MIVLVNDASILIDLLKLDLLDPFFQLPCQFHVTDLAAGEILEENVDELNRYIEKGTLLKRSFGFEELLEISQIQNTHRGLSLSDCSSVFLSKKLSATLLTGDAVMRRVAKKMVFGCTECCGFLRKWWASPYCPNPLPTTNLSD